MIIEMMGLPGVGKSTTARNMVQEFGDSRILHRPLETWLSGLRGNAYLVSQASSEVLFFSPVFRLLRNWPVIVQRTRRTLDLLGKGGITRKKSEEAPLWLLDQWICQDIWSAISMNTPNEAEAGIIGDMIRRWYSKEHLVIFLDAHPGLAAKRVSSRIGGTSPFDGGDPRKIEVVYRMWLERTLWIHEQLTIHGVDVVTVNEGPDAPANLYETISKRCFPNT